MIPKALIDDRHPEVRAQRASKDERPRLATRPSPFEALASLGHLRVTVRVGHARGRWYEPVRRTSFAALDRLAERADYAVIGPMDGRTPVRTQASRPYAAICHLVPDSSGIDYIYVRHPAS